jgi:hypothetical protein
MKIYFFLAVVGGLVVSIFIILFILFMFGLIALGWGESDSTPKKVVNTWDDSLHSSITVSSADNPKSGWDESLHHLVSTAGYKPHQKQRCRSAFNP